MTADSTDAPGGAKRTAAPDVAPEPTDAADRPDGQISAADPAGAGGAQGGAGSTEFGNSAAGPGAAASRLKYRADKLFKRLRRHAGRAMGDFAMLAPGDRVVVGMSGGKDSYALLDLLLSLQKSLPFEFTLVPVHVASGFPGEDSSVIAKHVASRGLECLVVKRPIYSLCREKLRPGESFCPLCSRLRRGALYETCRTLKAGKLALGHHKDDVVGTFLINLFYSGCLKAMPAVLRNDKDDLTLIRPLVYCRERDLKTLSTLYAYPVAPKGLCGFGEHEQRAQIGRMMKIWEREHPKRTDIAFRALSRVVRSHLYDPDLYDFSDPGQRLRSVMMPEGADDKAHRDSGNDESQPL